MDDPRPYSEWRMSSIGRWRDAFHNFGHLWFEEARNGALKTIPESASDETKRIAAKAIDTALYATMMIFEGVVCAPIDKQHRMEFALLARVYNRENPPTLVETIEIAPGGQESVCMGFHHWTEGNFRE